MKNDPDVCFSQYHVNSLPAGFFDLLPQQAVRYSGFPAELPHNAIWDFGRGHGNKMYAALCGELGASVAVQLYEYFPATGRLEFCFDGGPETIAHPRMIPPSKIHTSIQPLPDGTVIMTTHTTARSQAHPYWLFENYYNHQWEGFPGSHVLIWDPKTRQTRNLGIPVTRDSIYGAVYDPRHHALWFTTFLKGHLFRLDLTTREVKDFGQITEFGSYAIVKDQLGNLYTSSRSGHLFHIDVDKQIVSDLGVPTALPEPNPLWMHHRQLAHHAHGPDGRLYLSFHFSDYLYAVDPRTRKFERLETLIPRSYAQTPWPAQKGISFDSQGVLWFAAVRPINVPIGAVSHLHRWDLLRGGQSECVGLLGTTARATTCVAEMLMDENDVLHLADTNHGDDTPGILAVDTRKVLALRDTPREKTHDVTAYCMFPGGSSVCPAADFEQQLAPYKRTAAEAEEFNHFVSQQANVSVRSRRISAVRVWEHLPRGEAAVHALCWLPDGSLECWCGNESIRHRVIIQDAKVVSISPAANDGTLPCAAQPDRLAALILPSRQGRQFLAKSSCCTKWRNSQWLIGTQDGLLARYDESTGDVFSLGAVGIHGPIHQIQADAECRIAFGVSGDPSDMGNLFSYDDQRGMREIGRTLWHPDGGIVFSNTQPTTLALSPDGRKLAVGVIDTLACVHIYEEPTIV